MEALAAINERAASAHQEARAALEKTVRNYCPFGCARHELDDYGYCHHLVGFTNDRKTAEGVGPIYRTTADGTPFNSGFKIVSGSVPILAGDVFVNPERPQQVNGITHMAKEWASDRVYRQLDRPAEETAIPPQPSELYRLQARKKELEKKLHEKRLKEEIAALEEELGEAPATSNEEAACRKDIAALEEELTEPTTACDECDFVSKSAQGLNLHKQSKHPKPDQGDNQKGA